MWEWLTGRREAAPEPAAPGPAAAPAPEPAPAPARPAGAWRDLPPVQRSIGTPELTLPAGEFAQSLSTWHDPTFIGSLGHEVHAEGPGGLVHGLAAPVAPQQISTGPDLTLAPRAEAGPGSGQRSVQRSVLRTWDAPAGAASVAGPSASAPVVQRHADHDHAEGDGHDHGAAEPAAEPEALQRSADAPFVQRAAVTAEPVLPTAQAVQPAVQRSTIGTTPIQRSLSAPEAPALTRSPSPELPPLVLPSTTAPVADLPYLPVRSFAPAPAASAPTSSAPARSAPATAVQRHFADDGHDHSGEDLPNEDGSPVQRQAVQAEVVPPEVQREVVQREVLEGTVVQRAEAPAQTRGLVGEHPTVLRDTPTGPAGSDGPGGPAMSPFPDGPAQTLPLTSFVAAVQRSAAGNAPAAPATASPVPFPGRRGGLGAPLGEAPATTSPAAPAVQRSTVVSTPSPVRGEPSMPLVVREPSAAASTAGTPEPAAPAPALPPVAPEAMSAPGSEPAPSAGTLPVQLLPDDARVSDSLVAVDRWRPEPSAAAAPRAAEPPAVQRAAEPGAPALPLAPGTPAASAAATVQRFAAPSGPAGQPQPGMAPVLAYLPPLPLGHAPEPAAGAAAPAPSVASAAAPVQRLADPVPSAAPAAAAAPTLPSLLTTVRPETVATPLPATRLPLAAPGPGGPAVQRTVTPDAGTVQRSWGGGSADVPAPRVLTTLPGPLPAAGLPPVPAVPVSRLHDDAPAGTAPAPVPASGSGSPAVQRAAAAPASPTTLTAPAARPQLPTPPLPGVTDPGTFALSNGFGRMDDDGSVVFDFPGLTVSRSIATSGPAPTGLQAPVSSAPATAVAPPAPAPEPVQREVAAEAAAPEAAPAEAPAPSAAPAAPAAPAGAAPGTPGGVPIEELARQLYDPLAARLRAELWLDRERAGLITDLRR